MRRFLALLALLIATPLYAQDADSLAAEVRAETIRMRGFNRAAETQGTKILALIDSLRALPPAGGVDTVLVGDTVFVTDTVEVQLPPDTVTVVDTVFVTDTVFVEPSEPPPAPTMYVAGFAVGDSTEWTDHGLHVEWVPMVADSFRVTGGKQDGSDPFEAIVAGADSVYRHRLSYDTVTAMQACVSAYRHDLEGPEACDEMDWAPMARSGDYELLVTYDGTALGVELNATSGAWDGIPRDDSQRAPGVTTVEFDVGGETTTEQWFPYTASEPLPPGTYAISWRVNGDTPASGQATVTVPFEDNQAGIIYGELSNVVSVTP